MAITQGVCTSFKQEVFLAQHNFNSTGGHVFKIALYTSAATIGPSTTAYSSTNEITGTGYTAGGATLTNLGVTVSGTTAVIDFNDPAWTTASFTARGALIYNTSASNKAVVVIDFGSDKTVTASTFTIVLPTADASNAIIRMA